jgi:hypothetical protein
MINLYHEMVDDESSQHSLKRQRNRDQEKKHWIKNNVHASELAGRALSIVLQYWLVPNLGWNINLFDGDFISIQNDIIALSSKHYESERDRALEVKSRLQKEWSYFDNDWLEEIHSDLEDLDVEALVPASSRQVRFHTIREFCFAVV